MKKMKKPQGIILHCTATPEGRSVTVKSIRNWHKARGWDDVGYHFVIGLKGELWAGRSLEFQGAHTKGHNNSVGVAYVGGLTSDGHTPKDTLTEAQEATFLRLLETLRAKYGDLALQGHNEFSSKACPSFDVVEKFGYEVCLRDDPSTQEDESEGDDPDGPVLPLDEIVDEE